MFLLCAFVCDGVGAAAVVSFVVNGVGAAVVSFVVNESSVNENLLLVLCVRSCVTVSGPRSCRLL